MYIVYNIHIIISIHDNTCIYVYNEYNDIGSYDDRTGSEPPPQRRSAWEATAIQAICICVYIYIYICIYYIQERNIYVYTYI